MHVNGLERMDRLYICVFVDELDGFGCESQIPTGGGGADRKRGT